MFHMFSWQLLICHLCLHILHVFVLLLLLLMLKTYMCLFVFLWMVMACWLLDILVACLVCSLVACCISIILDSLLLCYLAGHISHLAFRIPEAKELESASRIALSSPWLPVFVHVDAVLFCHSSCGREDKRKSRRLRQSASTCRENNERR